MIILLHVVIAISSIVFTSYTYMRPSVAKLKLSYGLVGATLATGLYLVMGTPSHMLNTCITGLLYIGVVSIGIVAARAKLTRLQAKQT